MEMNELVNDAESVLTALVALIVATQSFYNRHIKKGVQALRNGELESKVRHVVREELDEYRRKHGL